MPRRHRFGDVAVLADTSTVVERQEPVRVAVAAAVRERTTDARRHVVEVALFGRPARTGLRRQVTDLYTPPPPRTLLSPPQLVHCTTPLYSASVPVSKRLNHSIKRTTLVTA